VPVAAVRSAPLEQIAEWVLLVSDNEAAEVLARHVGLATAGTGSFEAGVAGVLRTLRGLGVRTDGARVLDGSGLSRENRLDPDTLLDVLRLASSEEHPELRSGVTGLPVAGFSGSLELRFADVPPPGRGQVRAKTGTLTGVSALAGVVTDLDGSTMLFVLAADRVALLDTLDAREALDDAAAALAACHCSVRGGR
jgi:D-alanyl-D-alanine carboxypeptidase/D-alanyl-D-alanine-endopeptidase (penicillin-binding protein 4)